MYMNYVNVQKVHSILTCKKTKFWIALPKKKLSKYTYQGHKDL